MTQSNASGIHRPAWAQRTTEHLADALRFASRGALLLNGIIVSLGSIYVVVKLVYFTIRWLDRMLFSQPW